MASFGLQVISRLFSRHVSELYTDCMQCISDGIRDGYHQNLSGVNVRASQKEKKNLSSACRSKVKSIIRRSSPSVRNGYHFLPPLIPVCSVLIMGATVSLHHWWAFVSSSATLRETILIVASLVVILGRVFVPV